MQFMDLPASVVGFPALRSLPRIAKDYVRWATDKAAIRRVTCMH